MVGFSWLEIFWVEKDGCFFDDFFQFIFSSKSKLSTVDIYCVYKVKRQVRCQKVGREYISPGSPYHLLTMHCTLCTLPWTVDSGFTKLWLHLTCGFTPPVASPHLWLHLTCGFTSPVASPLLRLHLTCGFTYTWLPLNYRLTCGFPHLSLHL